MTTFTAPYDLDTVLDRVLAPFEKWADAGYTEGVLDLVPSLGRAPLLLSPSSVAAVFQSAFFDIERDNPTEADKAEVAKRFEFIERLMDQIMTRENLARDRYYVLRNRGMVHRTAAMLVCIGLFVAASVSLPTWTAATLGAALACSLIAAHRKFNNIRSGVRVPSDRAAQILAALPWMEDARGSERIPRIQSMTKPQSEAAPEVDRIQ